jgi:hypothetical protein
MPGLPSLVVASRAHRLGYCCCPGAHDSSPLVRRLELGIPRSLPVTVSIRLVLEATDETYRIGLQPIP